MSIYGDKLRSEVLAERNAFDRQAVNEIMSITNVDDEQLWHIIYLLALEMVDRDAMLKITRLVKESAPQVFLTPAEATEDD